MKVPNKLSKMLSTAGEKAAYDNACKKLLSNKIILAWIMKSCLQEYRECTIQEIADKYIEGDLYVSEIPVYPDEETPELIKGLSTEDTTIAEGTVTYDIRFSALIPGTDNRLSLIINVEPQNNYYPGYPIIKRSIYYCCRMVSSQYGTVFTNSHYEKIKKVYNVFICINPPNYRKNTINRYSVKEENMIGNVHEKEENYDLLTNVIICLGDAYDKEASGILRMLEVLLSDKRNASEKRMILQDDFGIQMEMDLESEVTDVGHVLDDVAQRNYEKGVCESLVSSIKTLTETMNWSVDQAMDALKISEEDKEEIRKKYNIG